MQGTYIEIKNIEQEFFVILLIYSFRYCLLDETAERNFEGD